MYFEDILGKKSAPSPGDLITRYTWTKRQRRGGVHPHGPPHQTAQGGGHDHLQPAGHLAEQQERVPAGCSAKHQGPERVWEVKS